MEFSAFAAAFSAEVVEIRGLFQAVGAIHHMHLAVACLIRRNKSIVRYIKFELIVLDSFG